MPQATNTITTPTRRSVMAAFSVAAIALPAKAATSPDAAIIATIDRLLSNRADMDRLYDQRTTVAEEHLTQPAMDALIDKGDAILDELEALPMPVTLAGIQAFARAAMAFADGNRLAGGAGEWLGLTALEALGTGVQI